MLRLENITKDYKVAEYVVRALKGISLSFRKNEFVSILGPSGCGKTTLLNLVGGLDHYTTGDMYIGGVSTKNFKDNDWDVYRNHRIGFIFQSYNLIPHQTVLGNVELALTIAGMSKQERVEKAKLALDKVGLSDQYYKKPNQLSGGQCQRVAIARALVNDPEILLADEPTGALDTKTSVQIMNLIKEIAQERLVIMVTHNPELAVEYSTRIIRLLDGVLQDDSNPFTSEQEKAENKELATPAENQQPEQLSKKKEKAKMSVFTAFRLSLQNLFTKKARTIMTSIAGSIGIIGISLVLSISYGVQSFINDMQNDMLSGNPITISETVLDVNALLSGTDERAQRESLEIVDGHVNVESMIEFLVEQSKSLENLFATNTITQELVDFVMDMPEEHWSSIFLDYGLDITNNFFTDFSSGGVTKNVSLKAIQAIYGSVLQQTDFASYASMISSLEDTFMQLPNAQDYITSQYGQLTGRYATAANEVMIVVDRDQELTDLLLAQLGYFTQEEFLNLVHKATDNLTDFDQELYDERNNRFSFEELLGKSFYFHANDTVFEMSDELKALYGLIMSGTNPADAGLDLENMQTFIPFNYTAYSDSSWIGKDGSLELTVVGILEPNENLSYGSLSSGFYYTDALAKHIIAQNITSEIALTFKLLGLDSIAGLTAGANLLSGFGIPFDYEYYFPSKGWSTSRSFVGSSSMLGGLSAIFGGGSSSNQVDEGNLITLSLQQIGAINLPSNIFIYPVDFEQKDKVLAYLDRWNSEEVIGGLTLEERDKLTYQDTLSLIIAIINTFIQVITIALIGFTALSLLVSSVMIGIITYVSVVERIKEIGVIRSLGGRKRDVSNLFTAETFIIGAVSGLIGIGFTYFASAIINFVVSFFVDYITIAIFPFNYALIMMAISIGLTLISGVLPSRSAARKDPVVALRTE